MKFFFKYIITLYFSHNLILFIKIIKKHYNDFHAEHFRIEKIIAIIH